MAFGDGGLIRQAELARDMTANSTVAENEGMNSIMGEYANIMAEDGEIEEQNTVETILKEGDYVNYEDGTGTTRTCVVLYGPENYYYESYGIQIITMETVEDVEIGNGTGLEQIDDATSFETAINSYNNVISTLNTRAQAYLNTTYASGARSVGSVPNNPTYDGAGMHTNEEDWFADYNGKLKDGDENCFKDWDQMRILRIQSIDEIYWLASRYVNAPENQETAKFHVYCGDSTTDFLSYRRVNFIDGYGDTTTVSRSYTYGLRVVFTLKPDIKVTGGNGEESSPYTLGV